MDKNKRVEYIYEKIANKDISYWLRFIPNTKSVYDNWKSEYVYIPKYKDDNLITIACLWIENWEKQTDYFYDFSSNRNIVNWYSIKGHPVMLTDIINFLSTHYKWDESWFWELVKKIIECFTEWVSNETGWLLKPIEAQDEDSIFYIYTIIRQYEKSL